jgi:type IV secretion system protein VirD4
MQEASLICHDPSGELYQRAAGYLVSQGYTLKVINYANAQASDGFNPLHRIRHKGDISYVASTLVHSGQHRARGDPFWSDSAEGLLSTLIGIILTQPPEQRHLKNVLRLLDHMASNPEAVDQLFIQYAPEELYQSYKAFIALPEKTSLGVVAQAKSALKIFTNDEVAQMTAFDTLDLESLRNHKTAVFIQNAVLTQEYFAPLTSILFGQLFEMLLGALPNKQDRSVFVLVDEASSFKANWNMILANCRKFRVGCLLAYQEYSQVVRAFGASEAEAIRSNAFAKLYFTNQPLTTASELEKLMGQFEYEDEKGIRRVRPLMTSSEVREMSTDEALLLAGNNPVIRLHLRPYYKTRLQRLAEIPAPRIASKLPFSQVPLLNLKQHHAQQPT